jgi:hypothetical protein
MYIATIQNNGVSIPIHDSKEKLISGKVTKGINTIDSFQFSMLPSNAGFDEIHDYKTLVKVYNTNKRRYDFYGRVFYSEDTMDESGAIQKDVICESYFGFLCDSQQEYVEEQNWTVRGLLEHIINTHNSQMESYKRFVIGEVTVTDPNDNIYIGIQRENTWETLNSKLIDKLGGELRFRVEGDVIYLDYLVEIGEESSTEIALSRNMKSIAREKDPSEIVTRIIPLGHKLTSVNADGTDVETERRLDITLVNDDKNYIEDEAAIALYGIRVATVIFDDVTVASTLKTKGEKWLAENNKIRISYTATALDLSLIGLDTDDFDVGNRHVVKNHLLNIDDTVRIIKKSIDICEEIKSTIEFGDNVQKLSDTLKQQSSELKQITSDYATNKQVIGVYEKTTSLIQQTDTQIRLDLEGELVNYVTETALGEKLKEYATITSLYAEVNEYLSTSEGVAAIKMAVEGAFVTDDDLTDALGEYISKTEVGAEIEAYIDTDEGIAKINSVISGSYVKKSALDDLLEGYAKISDIPELEDYLLKSDLNAGIETYINTVEGRAGIISAVEGTFVTRLVGLVYETPSDVAYGFELTDDGYYTSTNAGIDSSFSYGKFTFRSDEARTVILRCINYGEPKYDYGVISKIGVNLKKNNIPYNGEGILHEFYNESSPEAVEISLDIPAGESFITFKYCKYSDVDENGDFFKIMVIADDYARESQLSGLVQKTELDASIESYIESETGKAQIVSAVSGTYVTQDTLDDELAKYTKTTELDAEIGAYIDGDAGKAKIINAVSGTYVTQDTLNDELVDYTKTTELDAKIEAYIEGDTGTAKIVNAVSGTYVTQDTLNETLSDYASSDDLKDYLVKTELNAGIEAYINTTEGSAKISSVVSGDFVTSDDLNGYATTTQVSSSITQAINDFEATLELAVTNDSESSTIYLKSDGVTISSKNITFNGMVTYSDLETKGGTTINGANISTDNLYIENVYCKNNHTFPILATEVEGTAIHTILGVPTNMWTGSDHVTIHGENILFVANSDATRDLLIDFGMARIASTLYNGWDLGSPDYPFDDVYCDRIYLGGTMYYITVDSNGKLVYKYHNKSDEDIIGSL